MNKKRKILCLDQSTKITGWSFWQETQLKDYGLLNSNIKENNPILRMKMMSSFLEKLIDNLNPDYVVIEHVQFQNNFRTYGQLSQLQGVIFNILFERNIGFCLIEPTAWRAYSNIKGRKRVEQKANTIQMVKNKFNITVTEDEADSIGIGLWAIDHCLEIAN